MTARIKNPSETDRTKKSAAQKRAGFAESIGKIIEEITGLEYKVGAILWDAIKTYPDTPSGRKAFYSWASLVCGGRKEGMIRRWMTAASVLHRVPTFKTVSTKLDTLQFVAGLPDEDIAAIGASFEGKPAPTEAAVKKAALKFSDTAKKREEKRLEREGKAAESDRVKNDAAVEQLVSRNFKKFADNWTTLQTLSETKPHEALELCALHVSALAAKHAQMPRAIKKMVAKFNRGDHLADSDES